MQVFIIDKTIMSPFYFALWCYRKEVAEVLLSFGGQCGMRNGQGESVIDIINKHPEHRQKDFLEVIDKYRGQKPKLAKVSFVQCITIIPTCTYMYEVN